jgi:LysM repeat protein
MNNKLLERGLVIAVVITSLVVLYSVVQDHAIHNEWVESRTIETIRVAPNETMWQIAEEYKPSWMDTREYIYEVKELNNLSDTYLYVGDEIQIYISNS